MSDINLLRFNVLCFVVSIVLSIVALFNIQDASHSSSVISASVSVICIFASSYLLWRIKRNCDEVMESKKIRAMVNKNK